MEKKYKHAEEEVTTVDVGGYKNILVVDDDENILNMLEAYLSERNFLVDVVPSGAEGLKNVMKKDYNVIICDLMMPNMSGDMFYRAVQRIKPQQCSRFLFITGFSMSLEIENFIRNSNALCLSKPFTLEKLNKSIEVVLKKPASA